MSARSEIKSRALQIALGELGVREWGGNNRGPRVEQYQRSVGLLPGEPWCLAFASWCFQTAADELQYPCPIYRTGGCAKFWFYCLKMRSAWCSNVPSVGAIAIHLKNPSSLWSMGHTGIVVSVIDEGVRTICGNTNEAGERDGDCVGYQTYPHGYWLGFVDIAKEGPWAQ